MIIKEITLHLTAKIGDHYCKSGITADVQLTRKQDVAESFATLAEEIFKAIKIVDPTHKEPPKHKSKRKPIKVSPEPATTPTPEQPPPIPKLLPKEELEALEDFISESRHAQYLRDKDRSWEGMDVKAWATECWRWLAADILQTKLPKPNELTTHDRDTIMSKLKERR